MKDVNLSFKFNRALTVRAPGRRKVVPERRAPERRPIAAGHAVTRERRVAGDGIEVSVEWRTSAPVRVATVGINQSGSRRIVVPGTAAGAVERRGHVVVERLLETEEAAAPQQPARVDCVLLVPRSREDLEQDDPGRARDSAASIAAVSRLSTGLPVARWN